MFRSRLVLFSPLVGLLAGALAWLAFAHGASMSADLGDLASRANALTPPTLTVALGGPSPGALAASSPIFALTTGPNAVADVAVQLSGLSRTPARTAALLSINGKPAEWLALGETRDDVTLDEVQANKVTVDTPTGTKDVVLGAAAAPASPPDKPGQAAGAPPGFHGLPPANAP